LLSVVLRLLLLQLRGMLLRLRSGALVSGARGALEGVVVLF